jgi:subtilisin family serine protease
VPKPEIAGPDGLTTPTYGVRGFFGTSASTPAVAGAVAVVRSRWPELTSREASERLRAWAFGDAPGWDDPGLGAGRARLPVPDAAGEVGCRSGDRALLLLVPLAGLRRRRSAGARA